MAERDRHRRRDGTVEDIDAGTDTSVGGDIDAGTDTSVGGDIDVETDIDASEDISGEPPQSESTGGIRTRVRERAGNVATGRSLAVALALVTAGVLVLGGVLPLGSIGTLLGVAAGAFLYGVGSGTRHYTETTLAGTLAGGVSAFLGNLVLSMTGVGVPLVAVGAVGGGLAGLVGHYLGRDLRDGLTRDL